MLGATEKRKRGDSGAPLTPPADYGPAFTRDRSGRLVAVWKGADAGLEIAEIPDADRSDKRATARVVRRIDPLLAILGMKLEPGTGRLRGDEVNRCRFVAAERLRLDVAIADGATGTLNSPGCLVSGQGGGLGPSAAMIDAQGRVRLALVAIRGPSNDLEVADTARLVVLGYATLDAIREARRCRSNTVRSTLLVALDRLVSHYDAYDGGEHE